MIKLTKFDKLKIGTVGRVLASIEEKGSSHGYELWRITGISRTTLYKLLPMFEDAGFIAKAEQLQIIASGDIPKKSFELTQSGRKFAQLYRSIKRE